MIAHLGSDYEAALSAIERALSFNASSAAALYFGSHIHSSRGNCARANDYASRALRRSPFERWAFAAHVAFAIAALQDDRYAEAASHLARAAQANSSFTSPRFLQAMALALAGSIADARQVARGALKLQPGFRTRLVFEIGLLPEFADKFAERARLLGLPDRLKIAGAPLGNGHRPMRLRLDTDVRPVDLLGVFETPRFARSSMSRCRHLGPPEQKS